MINVVYKEDGTIKTFGAGDGADWVLEPGETLETYDMTPEEFAGRFYLIADKTQIAADGTDEAVVTLYSNAGAKSVDVLVDELLVTVNIVSGAGTLPPIVADTPGVIVIKPADETQFCAAGNGLLTIVAR